MLPTFSTYAQTYPRKMLLLGLLIFLAGFALWVRFFISPPVTGIPVVTEPQTESFETIVQKQLEALKIKDATPPTQEAVTAQLEALTSKESTTTSEVDATQYIEQLKTSNN